MALAKIIPLNYNSPLPVCNNMRFKHALSADITLSNTVNITLYPVKVSPKGNNVVILKLFVHTGNNYAMGRD